MLTLWHVAKLLRTEHRWLTIVSIWAWDAGVFCLEDTKIRQRHIYRYTIEFGSLKLLLATLLSGQVAAERLLMQTLEELRRPKPDEHKAWHKPGM